MRLDPKSWALGSRRHRRLRQNGCNAGALAIVLAVASTGKAIRRHTHPLPSASRSTLLCHSPSSNSNRRTRKFFFFKNVSNAILSANAKCTIIARTSHRLVSEFFPRIYVKTTINPTLPYLKNIRYDFKSNGDPRRIFFSNFCSFDQFRVPIGPPTQTLPTPAPMEG